MATTQSYIQLPPDSTGKTVGTWTGLGGEHYHGFIPTTQEGFPAHLEKKLETIALLLGGVCERLDMMNAAIDNDYSPPDSFGL